jgi:hypothetical protein
MPLNSDQEMDEHIEEEAKQEGENHTQYVRKEEQKPKKKKQRKKGTIFQTHHPHPATTHSSPRDYKPSSPTLDSS